MDGFIIEPWEKGYPGFYVYFENAGQLNDFFRALKEYDKEPQKTAALCAIYAKCLTMSGDEKECTFELNEEYTTGHIGIERVDETIFHCLMTVGWSSRSLVIDLGGSIKGDYRFFGRFDREGFFPSEFHNVLEKVARNDPSYGFCGLIYADDGDHYSDRAEFKYADNVLTVKYDDDSGYWAQHPVSIKI